MTDREKVIKALQQCVGYEDADNKYTCIYDGDTNPNCPYGGTGDYEVSCMTKMMQDALALLKAQVPRVMEFDDVVGGDECWLEAINGACGYADCYACTGTGEVQVFRCKYDNPQYIMAKDYLKTWRCWTSRPTDEQRQAVKWE